MVKQKEPILVATEELEEIIGLYKKSGPAPAGAPAKDAPREEPRDEPTPPPEAPQPDLQQLE